MTGLITQQDRLTFADGALLNGLANYLRRGGAGYWQHHFDRLAGRGKDFSWYLGIADGKLIYAGSSQLSSYSLLKTLLRYTPPQQRDIAKARWRELQRLTQSNQISTTDLLKCLTAENLATPQRLQQAIQLKILSDLDNYTVLGSGWSKFIAVPSLAEHIPLMGCDINELLSQANQRRQTWRQISQDVPSLKLIPTVNADAWKKTSFSPTQRAKVESLVSDRVSLAQIAQNAAKDSLDIAQMFSKLVRSGVVELQAPRSNLPMILTIDDSPMLLKQFDRWLANLGYQCFPCEHAPQAMKAIEKSQPAVIFLDINMPVISGFELVKKIRSQEELSHIPIVILTGEQKLSNKWRAQWSGCEFLTKPMSSEEYKGFEGVLKELIPRLIAGKPAVDVSK
jgi:CheY-like chemotaxis protein